MPGCIMIGHAARVVRRMVENTVVIAVGQFLQRSALRAASDGLFLLCRPMCFPRALARLLPSAVRVRKSAHHPRRTLLLAASKVGSGA
jgi:hypothetical protein